MSSAESIQNRFVQTHIMQLAAVSLNAGYIQSEIDGIAIAVDEAMENKSPLDQPYTLFLNIVGKAEEAKQEFLSLNESAKKCSSIFFNDEVLGPLSNAFEEMDEAIEDIYEKPFHFLQDKIDEKMQLTVERLNLFRKNPTDENLTSANQAVEKLQKKVAKLVELPKIIGVNFTKQQSQFLQEIECVSEILFSLISPDSSCALPSLLNRLSVITHSQHSLLPEEKTGFGSEFNSAIIDQLPESVQNALDGKIYELSPHPKGGKDWGKLHRYDDLKRFEQAFEEVHLLELKKVLQDNPEGPQLTDDEMTTLFTHLHAIVYGPEDVDPVEWVKKHISRFDHLINDAIKLIRPEEDENSVESSIEVSQKDASFHSKEEVVLNPLESELDRLQQVSTSTKIDPNAVREILQKHLQQEELNTLYGIIYQIAEDKWVEDGWGEKHCADHLPRLIQAVKQLKLQMTH